MDYKQRRRDKRRERKEKERNRKQRSDSEKRDQLMTKTNIFYLIMAKARPETTEFYVLIITISV